MSTGNSMLARTPEPPAMAATQIAATEEGPCTPALLLLVMQLVLCVQSTMQGRAAAVRAIVLRCCTVPCTETALDKSQHTQPAARLVALTLPEHCPAINA
jgi:hypothetical protein